MSLISYKVELKLRWIKTCVLAAAAVENEDADYNHIIFTIKDTKFYIPVCHVISRKQSKLFSKGFERLDCWNEHKIKSENENTTN